MFNLLKTIIIIYIFYFVLRFIWRIWQNVTKMNPNVKGRAKKSYRNNYNDDIEDAHFEDIE